MSAKLNSSSGRIGLLDDLRGISIICMIFYHGFFTMTLFGSMEVLGNKLFDFFTPAEPYFAGLFIVISGICICISHSPLKRGIILAVISLALTAATFFLNRYIEGCVIYFGILHMLAVCMLIYALLRRVINHIPSVAGIIVNLFLYAITYNINFGYIGFKHTFLSLPFRTFYFLPSVITECKYLFPLGVASRDFYSADYFSLFPYMFLFFAAVFFGKLMFKKGWPHFTMKTRLKPVAYCGRHTLLIYIFHQPVIYAILYFIDILLK